MMENLSRRRFSLGAFAFASLARPHLTFAAAFPAALAFAAYRKGKRIGEQRMALQTTGDALTVRTEVDIAVKLGPVTAYRYVHRAVERWSNGRFEALETSTSAGGKRESVTATRTSSAVAIRSAKASLVAAAEALPFTHWNLAITRAPLFHPQTGKLLKMTARELGPSPVLLADGSTVEARRVGFAGEAQIDNWYDAAGVWTGLKGRLDDGSILEYRRL